MFGRNLFERSGVLSRKSAAGFAIELVVVFVGVYLAFLASDYQEELRDRDIRVKYYQSMILEFETLSLHLEQENAKIQLAAAFDSQNFESLDDEMLANIIQGIPLLELLEDRVHRFNQLLLPMQASGSPAYDAGGRLLAHLAWYPRLVREIEAANRNLHRIVSEVAIPDMEADRDRLLARRFYWPS